MLTERGWRRLYAVSWIMSAGVTGVAFRMWQLHLREVEQRAEEAERTRDEAARRRAVEERLRIARELHDSLTHSISVIRVQSGVAAHLARKRGEEVPPALLAIQEASADAARELRATLSVLRSSDGEGGSGLGQLADLVSRAQSAGLAVTVTVTGTERGLPPEVDQAAYRIVQEALTNVARHAGQVSARVQLAYAADLLTVRVDNDAEADLAVATDASGSALYLVERDAGPGDGEPGNDAGPGDGEPGNREPGNGGHKAAGGATGAAGPSPARGLGLIGMRERVAALGGRLEAGPREHGGFRVRAEIPVRATA